MIDEIIIWAVCENSFRYWKYLSESNFFAQVILLCWLQINYSNFSNEYQHSTCLPS